MARIRTIKPEFFKHEELFLAEQEEKLPLRVAFSGLWTVCDREGRFKWRPNTIKLDVLPFDKVDFSRVLDALATRGFIEQYVSADGELYGFVPTFLEHQVINNRESSSLILSPFDACATRDPRGLCKFKGKGKEGKGREEEGKGKGKRNDAPDALLAARGVDPKIAADWIVLRKQKRAAITETALDGIQSEAEKAGYSLETALRICCERGWAGFKAEWMQKGTSVGGVQDARLDVARQIMGGKNANHGQIIDVTPTRSDSGGGARLSETHAGVRQSNVGEVAGS